MVEVVRDRKRPSYRVHPSIIYDGKPHTERVDSLACAHTGLRFVSASRDGKALIWRNVADEWKCIELNTTTTTIDPSKDPLPNKRAKITMVSWSCDDRMVFTSSTKGDVHHVIKVWESSTGNLIHDLLAHTSDVFVLASNPWQRHILLSAGHDGRAVLWDVYRGRKLWDWRNFEHGAPNLPDEERALLDGTFSPDGTRVLISDYYGHLLVFGVGDNSSFEQVSLR